MILLSWIENNLSLINYLQESQLHPSFYIYTNMTSNLELLSYKASIPEFLGVSRHLQVYLYLVPAIGL